MPNILAHSHISAAVLGEDIMEMNLGSVLPDFVGMYHDRHKEMINIGEVSMLWSRGIAFHHETDHVYDKQPQALSIKVPFRAHLEKAGLSEGSSRLTATLLADIMVDRALLDDENAVNAFANLGLHAINGDTVLKSSTISSGFADYVTGYFKNDVPSHYVDPNVLAKIAYERLSLRARTDWARQKNTFSEDLIPTVAEIIDLHDSRVTKLGAAAIKQTIKELG